MWAVMFTCFMVALTLTTVANVLITMSVAPLFTALLARFMLGHKVAPRTWLAIVIAGAGIAWMYGHSVSADPKQLLGTLVALGVPIAGAVNWNTLQRSGKSVDLVPALLLGAVISCVVTLPLSLPFAASTHDMSLLAMLGIFQLRDSLHAGGAPRACALGPRNRVAGAARDHVRHRLGLGRCRRTPRHAGACRWGPRADHPRAQRGLGFAPTALTRAGQQPTASQG
jgi:hypothetical protein